ncbi:hypothetical protein RhiJN_16526 [Ceratobasidium sp. AG-Ba]|nr:hypothetical protein RhiJN_16526 [Ceratobasidium sp. AG-Ba]
MKRRVASTSSGRVRVVSIGGRPGSSFSSSSLSGVQRVERTYSRTQTNARVREAPNLREQTLRELNAIQQQEFARLNPDALPLSDSALHQSDASHWVDEDYDNSSTCTPHAAGDDDPLDELLLGSAKGNSVCLQVLVALVEVGKSGVVIRLPTGLSRKGDLLSLYFAGSMETSITAKTISHYMAKYR